MENKILPFSAFAALVLGLAFAGTPSIGIAQTKKEIKIEANTISCKEPIKGHLQGVSRMENSIIWVSGFRIIKTNLDGTVEKSADVAWHHGDCCFSNGKLYVAVNLGKFNTENMADSWVYVYDENLNFLSKTPLPDVFGGAGGIEFSKGKFYIVGGRHEKIKDMYIYEYSSDFKLVRRFAIPAEKENLKGVQTILKNGDFFYLGCYAKKGEKPYTLVCDDDFKLLKKLSIDSSYGMIPLEKAPNKSQGMMIAQALRVSKSQKKHQDLWLCSLKAVSLESDKRKESFLSLHRTLAKETAAAYDYEPMEFECLNGSKRKIFVKKEAFLDLQYAASATVSKDCMGDGKYNFQVNVVLKKDNPMGKETRAILEEDRLSNSKQTIAIILDGKVISTPNIQSEITGSFSITLDSFEQAQKLAERINKYALFK